MMVTSKILYWGIYGIIYCAIGLFVLLTIIKSIYVIKQQTIGIIERFGRFKNLCSPGIGFLIPYVDHIVTRKSLRIQELNVKVETKTQDNVFVNVKISVQYFIVKDKVYDAYYKLQDPHTQMSSYVFDLIRARVPTLKLDEVFEKKDDLADVVKKELGETMDDFGYSIVNALVTDIDPDQKVKEAMNEINAQQRMKMAAMEKGEGNKILVVKAAEAEAESKKLQGQGIANQRSAIIEGLKRNIAEFGEAVEGASGKDVMNLVLMTQYFDTLKEIGASAKATIVMVPSSPGGLTEISKQIREAIIVGEKATE